MERACLPFSVHTELETNLAQNLYLLIADLAGAALTSVLDLRVALAAEAVNKAHTDDVAYQPVR
jgi:hypothetical protein